LSNLDAIDSLWYLNEAVSLQDAACLVAGYEPTKFALIHDEDDIYQDFPRYIPVIKALKIAVANGNLEANIRYEAQDEFDYYDPHSDYEIDLEKTMVEVKMLKNWLSSLDVKTGFFFPRSTTDYLDQRNEHYSPKLVAAIDAWEAVTANPSLMRGTTAKQAMKKWLLRNANKYELIKKDGNPNDEGIEEIAKIANWNGKGGAPKTPEC
jgi:hypothetical protein